MQLMHDNDHVPRSPQAVVPTPASTDSILTVYVDSIRTAVAPPLFPTPRRRRRVIPLDFTPRKSDRLAKADRGLNSEKKAK